MSRGAHTTTFLLKVSPIGVFFIKESTSSWSQFIRTSPFCVNLGQNLDYFWLFEGVKCSKGKNKVTFVTEPQRVL